MPSMLSVQLVRIPPAIVRPSSHKEGRQPMAQERLPMRKIRELLRLKFDLGLSIHKITASLSIARSTVTECTRPAR